ncbi:MAG: hypothetical protein J5J00_07235 [Deltaproteobacteria bacterium]|nr:hypothetical protein [Deltaproteobacteria bacterium]
MRWSQLKKRIEELFDPELSLSVFCTVQRGPSNSIGRIWFKCSKEVVWDEPRNVSKRVSAGETNDDVSTMTSIMREYLALPREEIFTFNSPLDSWGLVEMLKAADRRIGKRRLTDLKANTKGRAALQLIIRRLQSRQ